MENILNQDLNKNLNVKDNETNSDITKCEKVIDEVKSNTVTVNISLDDIFNSNTDLEDLTFTLTREAKIPEGEFPFVLKRVRRENNQTTSYGLKDQIVWESEYIQKELRITSLLNMLADRGYILVNGKFKFNSNIFASHVLERTDLIALNNNDIGIYNKKGYYERFDAESLVLGRIAHVIMNEVEGKDLCNSFDEKEGIRAIQRSTNFIKEFEVDRNLINLTNGIFDLRTYELKNHSP